MRSLPLLPAALAVMVLVIGIGLVLTQSARGVDQALAQQRLAAERTAAIVRAITDEVSAGSPLPAATAAPLAPAPADLAICPASTPPVMPALPERTDLAALRATFGVPNVLMRIDARETWALYGRVRLVLHDGWLASWRDGGGHDHPWP